MKMLQRPLRLTEANWGLSYPVTLSKIIRLSEKAPLEDTGRPKLFMVILQFDATCSALCKATE